MPRYKDVQIPGSVACISRRSPSFCGVTSNAGKATFKGVELEFNARLGESIATDGDRFNLFGAVGYIDAQL